MLSFRYELVSVNMSCLVHHSTVLQLYTVAFSFDSVSLSMVDFSLYFTVVNPLHPKKFIAFQNEIQA